MVAHNTRLGLEENLEAALSYVLLFVSGIIFYVLEEENSYIRFHALQSIIVFGMLFIVGQITRVFWVLPFIGHLLYMIINVCIGLFAFLLWILLILKAYKGERYKVPFVGPYAEKHA